MKNGIIIFNRISISIPQFSHTLIPRRSSLGTQYFPFRVPFDQQKYLLMMESKSLKVDVFHLILILVESETRMMEMKMEMEK